jgi:hypothetical protein
MVAAVQAIECRADNCFQSLKILQLPWNVAVWALLTFGIKKFEEQYALHGVGSPNFRAALRNLGIALPVAMKWSRDFAKPASALASKRWNPHLESQVTQAFEIAHNYSTFLFTFPMWHKDRQFAQLLAPNAVRFASEESERGRQVCAHHKSFRRSKGPHAGEILGPLGHGPAVREQFEHVIGKWRKTGRLRFQYSDPWLLWSALLPEYKSRFELIARRDDALSLGEYTLGDLKQIYAALCAVCAAHDFLCYQWQQHFGTFPLDSAVLIRRRTDWCEVLREVSGINIEKCDAVVRDLTFDFSQQLSRMPDLHVSPFIPLDTALNTLAVAPQFPLNSRSDENVLRVCSMLRPLQFNVGSLGKEAEMRVALESRSNVYQLLGPISLPKPVPDIDLLIADDESSTVVIAEMKWIRKPTRPVESIERDADVLKGVSQLSEIRTFVTENPGHLLSIGKLPKRIDEYRNVYYLLVARDHWLWIEPAKEFAIVEYDAFVAALNRPNLDVTIRDLLKYEWLPIEGLDFRVQVDTASVNGVSLFTEVYYGP